ncbi:MAG: phage tail protein, partial [Desulfuromonadales bacterium]|nr:phage tail protein [Desulfuromonadales bacterium]
MAATIAYSAYAMATAPDMPGYSAEVRGRTQVVRSAVTPRRIIYGQCMVSGPLAYALSYGKDNKYLYMVILLANHEVEEIGDIYLGDKLSTDAHFLKTDVTKTYKIGTDGKLTVTDDDWIGDKTHWPGYIILPNNSYALVTPHINNGTYDFGIQNAGASIALTYSRTYVKITKHYGAANQAADEDLIKNSDGQWTVNHTLSGIAYLTVRLEFDNTVFATGIPNIKAVLKGKKDIYDPRTKSYQYTDNWALCILDYLCADFGLNCSLNEINLPAAIEAANLCEEAVYVQTGTGVGYSIDNAGYEQGRRLLKLINGTGTILNGDQITITAPAGTWNKVDYIASTHTYDIDASGGLRDGYIYLADPGLIDALPPTNCSVTVVKYNIEKRYTCNGTFSVDQKPVEIMKKLLTGAAGTVVWSQGCYIIQPAKWAPPVMALTESDLRDKISIQTGTSIRDKCNTVRGTYVSPANSWQQTDFPMQQSSIALNNDAGEELCQNIELPYTISCPMAQRIARIHLYKSLYGQTINFPAKMTPFVLQPGDNIWLNLPLLGFNRAIFKVMSW